MKIWAVSGAIKDIIYQAKSARDALTHAKSALVQINAKIVLGIICLIAMKCANVQVAVSAILRLIFVDHLLKDTTLLILVVPNAVISVNLAAEAA
jgi:FtsH-binding integral membrane protein